MTMLSASDDTDQNLSLLIFLRKERKLISPSLIEVMEVICGYDED